MPESFPFGLLDRPSRPVSFAFGEVRPLIPDITNRIIEYGQKQGHHDGWLYPSTQGWIRSTIGPDGEIEVPWPQNEPKPEHWVLEASHELVWNHPSHGDSERNLPAIAINALGWAYGNRVQFDDWFIDGRVRWKCAPAFSLASTHLGYFLDRVVETALTLPGKQVELLGALILHNRAPMYNWDWERFHWQYVVFDACWRLLQHKGKVSDAKVGHAKRIATACDSLGIPRLPDVEKRVVARRNVLAHQGLWCEGVPGYNIDTVAFHDYIRVRRLVDRILLHLFDVDCGFRTRSWELNSGVVETMDMMQHGQSAKPTTI